MAVVLEISAVVGVADEVRDAADERITAKVAATAEGGATVVAL